MKLMAAFGPQCLSHPERLVYSSFAIEVVVVAAEGRKRKKKNCQTMTAGAQLCSDF